MQNTYWLQFDQTNVRVFGQPSINLQSDFLVKVQLNDKYNVSSQFFLMQIRNAVPRLANPKYQIPEQTFSINKMNEYFIPEIFVDEDGDQIFLDAYMHEINSSELAAWQNQSLRISSWKKLVYDNVFWLSFDAQRNLLAGKPLIQSGIPKNNETGRYETNYIIQIQASDYTKQYSSTSFVVVVINYPPTQLGPSIQSQFNSIVGSPVSEQVFEFKIDQKTYVDRDGDPLTYKMEASDFQMLQWINFEADNLVLRGKPPENSIGKKVFLTFKISDGIYQVQATLQTKVKMSFWYIFKLLSTILGKAFLPSPSPVSPNLPLRPISGLSRGLSPVFAFWPADCPPCQLVGMCVWGGRFILHPEADVFAFPRATAPAFVFVSACDLGHRPLPEAAADTRSFVQEEVPPELRDPG